MQQNINKRPMSLQSNPTSLQFHILKRYTVLKKIGSGAYGHVWKIEQKNTKKIFALKKIFDAFQHATDAQRTYRQIEVLRQLDHPNIIKLHETIRAQNNRDVYLVFEFMEADLHNVISQNILKEIHMKYIIYQLGKALKYLHSGKVIHRDLKPSNVLVNSNCSIKLCDFGLVRCLNKQKYAGVMTQGVATRWYRSPQILFGSKNYSTPADVWSFGCIIYEILTQKILFPGNSTLDQIQKICSFTGYPSQEDINSLESDISRSLIKQMKVVPMNSCRILKQVHKNYADLLQRILIFNPKKRMTIQQILHHQIFKQFHKPEQQISCQKEINLLIDDSKKTTVDQYRDLIYGITSNQTKTKSLMYSHSAGSVASKYPTSFMKSAPISPEAVVNQIKTDLSTKKHLFNKLKQQTVNTINDSQDQKNVQKIQFGARFVRSTKDNAKGDHLIQSFHNKKFFNDNRQKETQNQQEADQIKNLHRPQDKPNNLLKTQPHLSQKTHNPFPFSLKYSPQHINTSTNSTNSMGINVCRQASKPMQNNNKMGAYFPQAIQIKQKIDQLRSVKSANHIQRTYDAIHKFSNGNSPQNL